MRKTFAIAATAAALFAASGVSPAQAAPAAPVPIGSAPCPSGIELCLYGGVNFGGTVQYVDLEARPIPDDGCYARPFGASVGSAVNKSTHDFYVYDSGGCSGTPWGRIYARSANDNLGPNGSRLHSVRVI